MWTDAATLIFYSLGPAFWGLHRVPFYIRPIYKLLEEWTDAATQILYSLGPAFEGLYTERHFT